MDNQTITKTLFFNASREVVWAFLTDKDKLGTWFHPADRNLQEGQDYALMGKADDGTPKKMCWGTVIEMQPPSKLVQSFTVGPLSGAMTTVTWNLEQAGDGTRLTLEHSGFSEIAAPFGLLMALDKGWDAHFASLRTHVSEA
tara:strand:- start:19770 stop:20195 length:426 start_codon:yes stop_codon:yes gene_type:complete